jgi:NTP pyrophosphatase (non-canonical NTP hydrolase)
VSFSWSQLQSESATWVAHNFGDRPAMHPFLGIVEELGELETAVVKGDEAEVADACADVMIFMADLCNALGLDLAEICITAVDGAPTVNVGLGLAAHGLLKMNQGIRGTREEHLEEIQRGLAGVVQDVSAEASMWTGGRLLDVTEKIWREVAQRDWKRWPKTGRPPEGEAA